MFGSKDLLFSSEKYGVAKSLRFRASATAYLNRTPASAGNRTTWTYSFWFKRGQLSSTNQMKFLIASSGSALTQIFFEKSGNPNPDMLCVYETNSSGTLITDVRWSPVFRDPSAWYHFVISYDTTQATNTNRIKVYINGAQITVAGSQSTGTALWPTLSYNSSVNNNIGHAIGADLGGSSNPIDGYFSEVNLIDGQALTPSSFGFYDNNGIWQPQGYTGTYGTNGFYLKFTDVGATSGANTGYGKDFSGFNTNYWTTNNFGTTSTLATYDSMYDSPVNASNGITGIGNYSVLNPLDLGQTSTLTNANLTFTTSSTTNYSTNRATFGVDSGKWYWEVTMTSAAAANGLGIAKNNAALNNYLGADANGYGWQGSLGSVYNSGSGTTYNGGATFTNNDIIGVALDMSAGTLTFYKNGVSQGTAASSLTGVWFPAVSDMSSSSTASMDANFGQRPFAYTPPSGFSALNTQNLTTPTITNGASYMAAVTYTGNGSTQTITTSSSNSGNNPNGTTFQPDFVWAKGRSGATDHALYDAVRGVQLQLESNTTGAETTETTGLTAFTSSGFTTGALAQMNTNTATYVAWEWNAGGSNATNTTGTIQSTVRANTSAGFSVVTYTGNATSGATVGHGLGVAPSMLILKNRDSGTRDWIVYHTALGNTGGLQLNTTAAFTAALGYWNNTTPDSAKFTIGDAIALNGSTNKIVAYCFAPVAGYSAFGSYTGNGSTNGPFVYTGFRPRFILTKRTDTAGENWIITDSSRSTYNPTNPYLAPDLSIAEGSAVNPEDILSNGFKLRYDAAAVNTSGGTYIYAAFAENPFKISRAR
jgi:hypothetical protein